MVYAALHIPQAAYIRCIRSLNPAATEHNLRPAVCNKFDAPGYSCASGDNYAGRDHLSCTISWARRPLLGLAAAVVSVDAIPARATVLDGGVAMAFHRLEALRTDGQVSSASGTSPKLEGGLLGATSSASQTLPSRRCLVFYDDGGGCALNVRVPQGWRELDPRYGLRFQLRALRFALPSPAGQDIDRLSGSAEGGTVLEIVHTAIGPPPPRLRGACGSASPQAVEAQLRAWEAEFPPSGRTAPPRRTGVFSVEEGTAVSVAMEGEWSGLGTTADIMPGYALLAAVLPARPAGEGEQQYAFLIRAVGRLDTMAAARDAFAAFVRSAHTDGSYIY